MPIPALTQAQVPDALKHAIAFHQRGQFAQAKALYEGVIQAQPRHFQALHLLGLIAAQTGNPEAALGLIERAIEIFPGNPDFHINRGNVHRTLRHFDAALASYSNAIALKPEYAQAHCNQGVVLQELSQFQAAVDSYDRAIAFSPGLVEAHSNRGVALIELQQLDAAVASCERAIALNPAYTEAHYNRGNALLGLKQIDEAIASFDRAIAIRPTCAQAYFSRGVALHERKALEAALASYDQAIVLNPQHAKAFFTRGFVLMELGRYEASIASYDQAIAINPTYTDAHSNRAAALLALKLWEAAVASCDKAITLDPNHAQALTNRGVALHQLKQFDEAMVSYNSAIAAQPDYVQAHTNRGVALHALKQLDAAVACYDRAIAIQPDYAEAHFYKSLALLLAGDFERGWACYQWLWKTEKSAPKLRHFSQPHWSGAESLVGKTILVHSEQGLGDMIQFCRYAQLLADAGARVVLEVPPPLKGLLQCLAGVAELVNKGAQLPAFDYQSLLLSLPAAFKTSMDSIPGRQPYLHCDSRKLQEWVDRLGAKTRPRVGIVWSGSTDHAIDYNRSLPLAVLVPFLPDAFDCFSLQKEVREMDKASLVTHNKIRHFGDAIADFDDTAALCTLMDIVVSVDTSVAHLSAALGKPTWILLPYVPDWRWLLDRDDSPWYQTAKLYRQSSDGDWPGVLAEVKADLLSIATG
nr:tetratricopeptide repeat protein [uncultured Rhodoferax sp.]